MERKFTTIETPSKQHQPLFYMDCLFDGSENAKIRKNLEASSIIALRKPDLNKQKPFGRLVLFKNGMT